MPSSAGGKAKLFGISKRGNRYLRKILIHGARTAVFRLKRERAPMGAWMTALEVRAPRNVLIVPMRFYLLTRLALPTTDRALQVSAPIAFSIT